MRIMAYIVICPDSCLPDDKGLEDTSLSSVEVIVASKLGVWLLLES